VASRAEGHGKRRDGLFVPGVRGEKFREVGAQRVVFGLVSVRAVLIRVDREVASCRCEGNAGGSRRVVSHAKVLKDALEGRVEIVGHSFKVRGVERKEVRRCAVRRFRRRGVHAHDSTHRPPCFDECANCRRKRVQQLGVGQISA